MKIIKTDENYVGFYGEIEKEPVKMSNGQAVNSLYLFKLINGQNRKALVLEA